MGGKKFRRIHTPPQSSDGLHVGNFDDSKHREGTVHV